jgi:hypothetical protein
MLGLLPVSSDWGWFAVKGIHPSRLGMMQWGTLNELYFMASTVVPKVSTRTVRSETDDRSMGPKRGVWVFVFWQSLHKQARCTTVDELDQLHFRITANYRTIGVL